MMTDRPEPEAIIAPLSFSTEQRAKIFAALADPTRLRIVELLAAEGELSGSQIATQLDISLALFCHHSRTLVEADLLQVRRDGQTKYNSLNQMLLHQCLNTFGQIGEQPPDVSS
ncbi:ArsR/SmtB family transcription factor [Vacuolonema iberomarrocanum]|uniref:ArsR/SmtB family transcription factor n=1 Tax=Vacuolonema iberomarrocanum TaxID=3454632 RepID=UPI0019FF6E77|nr:helix-turn-helix transcriptional regulator [filamentous cyanobacterium LEGE 07170]